MRYVNLKKRNTSKIQYVSKRLAAVSFVCLALTAVIVVPLTGKAQNVNASSKPEVVEINNDYIDNGDVVVVNN